MKTQIEKKLRGEKFTIIRRLQKLQELNARVSILGLAISTRVQKKKNVSLLIGGEGLFILDQVCVHRGELFGHDPLNHMICACRFVLTTVIVSA